jgi:hypothetical protein
LGGDFNTVDPEDVLALGEDEAAYKKIVNMLNAVNWESGDNFYPDVVGNSELGVCAYLKEGTFHKDHRYRYRALGKDRHFKLPHTNWNLTKIDHIFVGQPEGSQLFETVAQVHPEPASDHLLLVLQLVGEAQPLPFFDEDVVYPASEEKRKEMKIPSTLAEAVQQNPFTRETVLIDEKSGLTCYYPQVFSRSKGIRERSSKFLLLAPMLLSKEFGNWNKQSFMPSGDAKIVDNPRRVRSRKPNPEFQNKPARPLEFPHPFGNYYSKDPNNREVSAPIYVIVAGDLKKPKGVILFSRPYVYDL